MELNCGGSGMVFDLSDPARPKKIRDFGLPGQQPDVSGRCR